MPRGNSGAWRDLDGILLLDKPEGPSSNQALQRARRILRARKAGHCGSLDPLATGLLPICLGQATRFSGYLLGADKTYRARCRLGETTETGDAEGRVVERAAVNVGQEELLRTLDSLVGRSEQLPPMYSALKHGGRRLYELAREGKQVERVPREVEISRLELLSFDLPEFEFEVQCSKGTYVRTLAEDIGRKLGCGAHLRALRRLAVGSLSVEDSLTLETLESLSASGEAAIVSNLMPCGVALSEYPEIELGSDSARDIRHGKRVSAMPDWPSGLVRLVSREDGFIGLGEIRPNRELAAKRLINTAR